MEVWYIDTRHALHHLIVVDYVKINCTEFSSIILLYECTLYIISTYYVYQSHGTFIILVDCVSSTQSAETTIRNDTFTWSLVMQIV